jgi:hypothetical protein
MPVSPVLLRASSTKSQSEKWVYVRAQIETNLLILSIYWQEIVNFYLKKDLKLTSREVNFFISF